MTNALRNFLSFLRFLAPRMWYVEGNEIATGDRLGFVWCGPEKQQEYLVKRIFGRGPVTRIHIGRRPIMSLRRIQESFDCTLTILGGPQNVLGWLGQGDGISIPWWIDAELDIEDVLENGGRSKSLREDLRRMRKNALACKIAKTADEWQYFYERIYLPTIMKSHGAAALPSSLENRYAEIEAGRGEIMFITMGDDIVGGLLLDYRREVPALRDIGVIDGKKNILKTGVITAANYLSLLHLREKGFKKVCLGLSRSFLDDGVLVYKQKWKPTLIDASPESFVFRVSRLTSASRSFFRASSFIAKQNGQLQFAFFGTNDDDVRMHRADLQRLSSIYGIDESAYIDLSGERPEMGRAS